MKVDKSLVSVGAISLLIFWSRMILHDANFSPVIALALISGFLGRGRWFGFVLPIGALFLSDLQIGFYPGWAFTYIPLVLAVVFGHFMSTKPTSILSCGLLGAVTFYLVSNFGVWLYSGMYTPDFSGLMHCYYLAIPFFRKTLSGTFGVMGLFYGASYFLSKLSSKKAVKST